MSFSSSSSAVGTNLEDAKQTTARIRPKHHPFRSLLTADPFTERRDLSNIDGKIWNLTVAKLHMNGYIVIGEQPTYPHNLITIKRTIAPYAYSFQSSPSHEIGTIVFWSSSYLDELVRKEQIQATQKLYFSPIMADQPSEEIIEKHVTLAIESNMATLAGNKTLLGMHTVWDVERDALAQFQFYNAYQQLFSNPIFAYGFAYGKMQYALYNSDWVTGITSVCFKSLGGPKEHAHIKALVGGRCLVLEPFVDKYRKHLIAGWNTTHLKWKEENGHDAVFSEINVVEIALEALKKRTPSSSFGSDGPDMPLETPKASKPHLIFTPNTAPAPTTLDSYLTQRNTIALTLGFLLPKSKSYHLTQFSISLSKRRIRLLRTLKLTLTPAFVENDDLSADELFTLVATRANLLPVGFSINHTCTQSCLDQALGRFHAFPDFNAAQSVTSLLLPRNGVRLLAPGHTVYRESIWSFDETTASYEDEEEGPTDVSNNTSFESMDEDDRDILMSSQPSPKMLPSEPDFSKAWGGMGGDSFSTEEDLDAPDSQETVKPKEEAEEEDPMTAFALSVLQDGTSYEPAGKMSKWRVAPSLPKPLRRTVATESGLFGDVELEEDRKREASLQISGSGKKARMEADLGEEWWEMEED